ncbi:MAG TPA: GNAT family N-acetyltransferase [Vicinamibacterales bacterium]|nr:GNAT family N-acetyltransferase [Vicinamibacterales bacterium]
MPEPAVIHRPGSNGRSGVFEMQINGTGVAFLDYGLPDERTFNIDYVEVTPAMRGRQLGERLVDAAVEWAKGENRRVTATCGFARRVLAARHPKTE